MTTGKPLLAGCPDCEGIGEVGCGSCRGVGLGFVDAECTSCAGSGTKDCERCEGSGEVAVPHVRLALVCTGCGDYFDPARPDVQSGQRQRWLDEHVSCKAAS